MFPPLAAGRDAEAPASWARALLPLPTPARARHPVSRPALHPARARARPAVLGARACVRSKWLLWQSLISSSVRMRSGSAFECAIGACGPLPFALLAGGAPFDSEEEGAAGAGLLAACGGGASAAGFSAAAGFCSGDLRVGPSSATWFGAGADAPQPILGRGASRGVAQARAEKQGAASLLLWTGAVTIFFLPR